MRCAQVMCLSLCAHVAAVAIGLTQEKHIFQGANPPGPLSDIELIEALPTERPVGDQRSSAAKQTLSEIHSTSGPFDFSKVPPVRPLPRVGLFPYFPSGPGYYSAWDCLTGTWRDKPPPYPYPFFLLSPLTQFEADWRYVDNPGYDPDLLERLKRIHVGENWLISTGGQMWLRYQNEHNSRLTESDNDHLLMRIRPYLDVCYQDKFRFFIEGMFATSVWHDVPPLLTDVDRSDFQNLFIEVKVAEVEGKPVYLRVGRQEINLGSLRLIAAPDWANIRRTFQGVRGYRLGEQWDVDLFWVQPVIPSPASLNSVDNNQNFAGAWTTYRPRKGTFLDAYYLMLDNTSPIVQEGIIRGPFTLHTLGGRYITDWNDKLLFETEAAIQLGKVNNVDAVAGMFTGGVGYHWGNLPWNPTLWAVYNYTSGDKDPNVGNFHTFNQLFPFIQYYMGWVDGVGRQNNIDLNLRLYLYPRNWITIWLQYHHFWLDEPRDALYGIAGNPVRRDPTGQAGTDVGQKIEILADFHLTKRTDLLLGYTHFWGGGFLQNTSGPNAAVHGNVFYLGCGCRW